MTEALARCPLCDSPGVRKRERPPLSSCRSCGGSVRLTAKYEQPPDDYWRDTFWTPEEVAARVRRAPVFEHAVRVITAERPVPGRLLDIGCGVGTLVHLSRQAGWDAVGIDLAPAALAAARAHYGLDILLGKFEASRFEEAPFDAVFMAQVLHHLPDPREFLEEVDRVLKPGGLVVIRTPNRALLEPMLTLSRALPGLIDRFVGPSNCFLAQRTFRRMFGTLGYRVTFRNSVPFLAPGAGAASLVRGLKHLVFGSANVVDRLSGGRIQVAPSILVLAEKPYPAR